MTGFISYQEGSNTSSHRFRKMQVFSLNLDRFWHILDLDVPIFFQDSGEIYCPISKSTGKLENSLKLTKWRWFIWKQTNIFTKTQQLYFLPIFFYVYFTRNTILWVWSGNTCFPFIISCISITRKIEKLNF